MIMETDAIENKPAEAQKRPEKKLFRNLTILALALTAGYIHYKYVSTLHENVCHFSHLSELEREMYLRTEMGFYYSYYKTIVQEQPFLSGISKIMYDRLVEYPKEVNAFNRFNIHPEVILGAIYRYLEPSLNTSTYRQCHLVYRDVLPPVESCVGIGHPIMFYLEAIWGLAGVMAAAVFLLGAHLSESILGGILSVVQYFGNHSECTRVMWSPNERENLAAPLLMLQMWLISVQLRERENKACFRLQVSIFAMNVLCLLFWQFTQFIFLTQTAIFFLMEQFRIIDLKTFCIFLHGHFCGLHMAVILLQGNDMLKTSLYSSFFLTVSVYCLFFSGIRIQIKNRTDFFIEAWLVFLRISIVVVLSIYLKKFLSDFLAVDEDNHIWDLLYSKFSDFKSFHTLMYTCSEVFGFLPLKTVYSYTKTLLLPLVLWSILNVGVFWAVMAFSNAERVRASRKKDCQRSMETQKEIAPKDDSDDSNEIAPKDDSDDDSNDDSGIENNTECALKRRKNNTTEKEMNKNGDDEILLPKMIDIETARRKKNVTEKESKETGDEEISDEILLPKIINIETARRKKNVTEKESKENDDEEISEEILLVKMINIEPAIFYNVTQMFVFAIMAFLFMRLKLLFGTHLCVLSSLAVNTNYQILSQSRITRVVFFAVAGAVILRRLYHNVTLEMSHIGEYSDIEQERLLRWISSETPSSAVFAGSLPISATVMLATRRAIVVHPHYENKGARDRAYAVYKMYGRFSPHELYEELTKLHVTHLIVENKYCYGVSNLGCSYEDIWDIEAPSYMGRPKLCHTLLTETAETDHLYRVYSNEGYSVFRVHDLSVRFMPRVFDS